jgi:hypothetical protein
MLCAVICDTIFPVVACCQENKKTMNELDPQLRLFAEVLLANEYPEFVSLFQDSLNLEFSDLCEKHAGFIQDRFGRDFETQKPLPMEEWEISESDLEQDALFLEFAYWKKRLFLEDWPGEWENGETAQHLEQMLVRNYHRHLDWDADSYYRSIDSFKLSRGEHPLLLYYALDKHLKTIGFRFFNLDIGADSYYCGVLPSDQFEKVHRLHWRYCTVAGVDDLTYTYQRRAWTVLSWFGIKKPYITEVLERWKK